MIDRNTQIVHAYRDGETLKSVGMKFGISPERVRQILVRWLRLRRNGTDGWGGWGDSGVPRGVGGYMLVGEYMLACAKALSESRPTPK